MDARMILRRVVDENQPQDAPDHGQTTLDVEDRFPAEKISQNAGEWERDDSAQSHSCCSSIHQH